MSADDDKRAPARRLLIVGGHDPSLGGGVGLDAFAVARLGLLPAVVVTTVTAQNSLAFGGSWPVAEEVLNGQLEALDDEGSFAAVKIGALGSQRLAAALARWLTSLGAQAPPVVVDPVLMSSSGGALVDDGPAALAELAGLIDVLTPNAAEASLLARAWGGRDAAEAPEKEAEAAGAVIAARLGCDVVVTGVPQPPARAADIVLTLAGERHRLSHDLVADGDDMRGTGCLFAAGLAAGLALDEPLLEAVGRAQRLVREGVLAATAVGRGRRQLDLRRWTR